MICYSVPEKKLNLFIYQNFTLLLVIWISNSLPSTRTDIPLKQLPGFVIIDQFTLCNTAC